MDINVCQLAEGDWQAVHKLAYYSHFIPVVIAMFLAIFVLYKTKKSLLSVIFLLFTSCFSLWLVFDGIIWGSNKYHLITTLWAPLDYINIVFYLLAVYFLVVLVTEKDISHWQKILLLLISLPAWFITVTGHSITGFNQPTCEALNSEWLTNYKLIVEVAVLAFIMFFSMFKFIKSDRNKRKQIFLVSIALTLFLAIFSATEYIASQTGVYEINLYSLFVLPIFLGMIIFSITNFRIFKMRTFGTQLLTSILLIMVGSQFFYLQNKTDKILTISTFAVSVFLGFILLKNVGTQEKARVQIEKLAIDLQKSNDGQTNLIHIMNHQIKGYLAKARGIFSELQTEPAYGPVSEAAKPMIDEGLRSLTEGVEFVAQVLNGSSAASGTMQYSMKPTDVKLLVEEAIAKQQEKAEKKGLIITSHVDAGDYSISADSIQLKEVIRNLIDNSIIYTEIGGLTITLSHHNTSVLIAVKDTGVGIADEDRQHLFTKGGRGKDALKINVNSTGYGLAFVKGVVEAHKGKVWVDSEGKGKGSTFYIELPIQ